MTNIQEILDKIGKSPVSDQRELNRIRATFKSRKKVYVFKHGKLFEQFDTVNELISKYGEAVKCRLRRTTEHKGLFFSYKPIYNPRKKIVTGGENKRGVEAFDKFGNLLGSYPSILECSKYMDLPESCIRLVCRGKRKHSRGYTFKYKNSLSL